MPVSELPFSLALLSILHASNLAKLFQFLVFFLSLGRLHFCHPFIVLHVDPYSLGPRLLYFFLSSFLALEIPILFASKMTLLKLHFHDVSLSFKKTADNCDQHHDVPSSLLLCPPCLSLSAQHAYSQSSHSHFLWPSTAVLEALASVPFPCYSFCLDCFGPSSCSLASKPGFLRIFWVSDPWLTSPHTNTTLFLCLSTDPLKFCCGPCCFVIIS